MRSDSQYGPIRYYNIEFDDGDTATNLKECVYPKKEYELRDKPVVGVELAYDYDQMSTDDWHARLVGMSSRLGESSKSLPIYHMI